MRKHDVRKWIHAVLDMLPLFIIPIFAIYMHRHPVTDYEVSTDGYEITEKFTTNDVNSSSDLVEGNIYHIDNFYFDRNMIIDEGLDFYDFTLNIYAFEYDLYFESEYGPDLDTDDDVVRDNYDSNIDNFLTFRFYVDSFYDVMCQLYYTNGNTFTMVSYDTCNWFEWYNVDFIIVDGLEDFKIFYDDIQNLGDLYDNVLNITSSTYQSYDYQYNEGLTYNDTDIGSQFLYALYKPIDKYFNFNKVATFGSIYNWFETTFFDRSAPLVVPIVWNIILYEFIMDVLFLIYVVFMFIIDFVECLIDKAFGKSYRGGR